jgi:hypothetical protein
VRGLADPSRDGGQICLSTESFSVQMKLVRGCNPRKYLRLRQRACTLQMGHVACVIFVESGLFMTALARSLRSQTSGKHCSSWDTLLDNRFRSPYTKRNEEGPWHPQ